MRDIIIIEKPDTVTYEEIHEILYSAHEENRLQGIWMNSARISADTIKERIGETGKCFLAMDGENIAGTVSVSQKSSKRWYKKGTVAILKFLGVVPAYKGKGVATLLMQQVEQYAIEHGLDVIELDTAETNKHAIEVYKKKNYHLVSYFSAPSVKHYSVVMAKWLKQCPYSKNYMKMKYHMRKFYIRLRFKPEKKKRFGI